MKPVLLGRSYMRKSKFSTVWPARTVAPPTATLRPAGGPTPSRDESGDSDAGYSFIRRPNVPWRLPAPMSSQQMFAAARGAALACALLIRPPLGQVKRLGDVVAVERAGVVEAGDALACESSSNPTTSSVSSSRWGRPSATGTVRGSYWVVVS